MIPGTDAESATVLVIQNHPGDGRPVEELLEESGLAADVRRETTLESGLQAFARGEADVAVLTEREDQRAPAPGFGAGAGRYVTDAERFPVRLSRTLRRALGRRASTGGFGP